MREVSWALLGSLLMLAGCASRPRTAASATLQDVNMQLVRLESRVGALEQRHQLIEDKAWTQREDVSYLKGRVDGFQGDEPAAQAAASSGKPDSRQIQKALKNAGFYEGAIDGKIGPKTRSAIREFQRANGLSSDGIVGRKTWAQLGRYAGE